jgi:nitrous oxide reductase accessory protein NosL
MRPSLRRAALLLAPVAWATLACGPQTTSDSGQSHTPEAIADQEDAVCGMLVREQSAPRSQVVHRDGSRVFFCSLGDMLIHLEAPSPHGRAEATFVEVLGPDEDPSAAHTGPHDWLPAGEAVYVVGVERPGIMGAPVLAYAGNADAERVASRHTGAEVLDLPALKQWWARLQAGN